MRRFALLLLFVLLGCRLAQGQSGFTPFCAGSNDTSRFSSLISAISSNQGTITVPFISGSRCAVNTMTIPANVTLDNTNGTGIKVNSGQVLTVLGPVINPVGRQMFFGPGTVSFVGNNFIGSNGQSLVSLGDGGVEWQTISGGGGGGSGVDSFNNRTGLVMPATGDYTWNQINKAASSIADITLRSADLLSNGTTGTGPITLADSPTLVTPVLGTATATSINGLGITPTSGTLTLAAGKTLTVGSSLTLAGTGDGFTLTVPGTGTAVLTTRTITEGAGLAGNTYDLSGNRTLALGTPSSLSVSSLSSVGGTTHSHAIASSSNPGAAASILATDPSGHLQVLRLGIATAPTQPLEVGGNAFINAATANLFMKDISTGWRSSSTQVLTPQPNNCIRSTDFTSGTVGWNICGPGSAEFADVTVRGAIRSSVITFNSLQATAGTFGVFKSAAKLRSDVTIPVSPTYGTSTVAIDVVDADGLAHNASQLFVVNDILRLKDGLAGDTWLRIASVSDQTTFWRYTATIMAGSGEVVYRTGLAVADYGQDGDGFIIQTADQANAPYLQMTTHTGTFSALNSNGSLLLTPRLRTGNLNGSYGYSTNTFGFATGLFGVAGQSWLTVDPVNGVRIGNNTTVLTQVDAAGNASFTGTISAAEGNIGTWTINASSLARDTGVNSTSAGLAPADFPFFAGATVANRATAPFRVTTAGGLTATNATITGSITSTIGSVAGWALNATRMSNGTTHLASGFDPPTGQVAWFGRATTGVQGWILRDSSDRSINAAVGGVSPSMPFLQAFDGTCVRVVVGGLDDTFNGGPSVNSMGMKVWNSSCAKLVEFSDSENSIGGFTITTNRISSTGIDINSGASASLSVGTTPPTGPTSGTGIWIDKDGLRALNSGTATVFITANGIRATGSGFGTASFQATNAAGTPLNIGTATASGGITTATIELGSQGTGTNGRLDLSAGANDDNSTTTIRINAAQFGNSDFRLFNSGGDSNIIGVTVGSNAAPAAMLDVRSNSIRIASAKTPASASEACTQGTIAWDSNFVYVCVSTNAWKRSAISTW